METEILQVNPKDLKLLTLNARYMEPDEFNRLVANIKRDGCLTQLPFVYRKNGELIVLSGNHRVQAAIKAGLKEIEVQAVIGSLTKDQALGIQLSHNAISGKDDMGVLKQLYESINDLEFKEYCGLDDQTLKLLDDITAQSMSGAGLKYQMLNFLFLPSEVKEIKEVIKEVSTQVKKDVTLSAKYEDYDDFLDVLNDVSKGTRIKNSAVTIMAMLSIVKNHIEDLKSYWIEEAKDKEYVPISTLIGRSDVTAKDGRVINKALEKLTSKGLIKSKEKDKGLAYLSEYYLENEKKKKEQSK